MFSLNTNYSISKNSIPDLFPEEKPRKKSTEANFLKESLAPFSKSELPPLNNSHFTFLKPTEVRASEEDLYENNGGTTLSIVVDNKIIIASDTRHSSDYTINSRKMTKVYKIGDFFLTAVGFYADGFEVYSKLLYSVKQYETYDRISLSSLARLLHNVLYVRRFFPLYVYTCLSGYEDGKAKLYSYDPVGSYQETLCRCYGSGSKMIQPLLDSWVMGKNFNNFPGLSFEDALKLVKKAFDSASERDVKTKDYLEIYVVEKDNLTHEFIELRKD